MKRQREVEMFFKVTSIEGRPTKWRTANWLRDNEGNVLRVELQSPFGTLLFGKRPEGYEGWAFEEEGGGGSITIPYTTIEGELYVGLIREERANMNGAFWCVIGGFKDPGESHRDAAVREALEEAGVDTVEARELLGYPVNANRAFFVADPEKGEGVHVYAIALPSSVLERLADGYGFREEIAPETRKALLAKGDGDVRFMHWAEAVRETPDGLALSAIVRLMADHYVK